jgi:hypothetical protein
MKPELSEALKKAHADAGIVIPADGVLYFGIVLSIIADTQHDFYLESTIQGRRITTTTLL